MIPAGFIQDLLARVDIVDVVGRHVELKRGGANLMGLCPFHAEKSPSFSVSPSKQFYYCFGCGATGDAIRFLTEHLGLSFVEAVRELAGQVGMQVPEEQVSAEERTRREKLRERRQSLGDVLDRAAAFYREQLKKSPRAIGYLKGRGLTGAVAARFGLGYAPPGWRTLAGVFPRYDDPLLEEAGLVRSRTDPEGEAAAAPADADRGRYDWFRDRVMFPIRAVSGEVIGFGGRVLDDGKPKYINSPETPLFSKGRELYGLYEARQALRERGFALVVEGYMDVVALAQLGLPNAVATLGTACTADHVAKLFRFTDAVVFSFDGDAAGRRAAARALEAALPHATDLRTVKFLFLPPEHDPDSYVREHGAPAFEAAVAAAVPLSRQLVELAREGISLDSAEGRARFLAQARPLWQALPEGLLKRQLLGELAREGGLSTDELAGEWLGRAGADTPPRAAAAQNAPPNPGGRGGGLRPPARSGSSRRAPAGPADLAVRLLFRHAEWWDRLSADDHAMLHALGGVHGEAVAWLEQQIVEHGPLPWGSLAGPLREQPWASQLRTLADGDGADAADPEAEQAFDDLQRVVQRLWIDRLADEAAQLAAGSPGDRDSLQRLRALHEQIARLKAAQKPEAAGAAGAAVPAPR